MNLEELCMKLEGFADGLGWDQVPMAFFIKDESITQMVGLAGGGKPYNILADAAKGSEQIQNAIKECDAVMIMLEGWTYPQYVMDQVAAGAPMPNVPPSQHTGRRELRNVIAFHKDGSVASVSRVRGEEEAQSAEGMSGPMVSAIQRLIMDPVTQQSMN